MHRTNTITPQINYTITPDTITNTITPQKHYKEPLGLAVIRQSFRQPRDFADLSVLLPSSRRRRAMASPFLVFRNPRLNQDDDHMNDFEKAWQFFGHRVLMAVALLRHPVMGLIRATVGEEFRRRSSATFGPTPATTTPTTAAAAASSSGSTPSKALTAMNKAELVQEAAGHGLDAACHRIAFGQYHGQTYAEIRRTKPGYAAWVVQQFNQTGGADCSPGLAAFARYLVAHGGQPHRHREQQETRHTNDSEVAESSEGEWEQSAQFPDKAETERPPRSR